MADSRRAGVLEDVFPVRQPGETIVRLGLRLPAGRAQHPPADPHQRQSGSHVNGGDGPVHGHRSDRDTPRLGRVAPMGQRGQAGELVVWW